MHRSTSGVRRACAVGTTIALIGLTTGLGMVTATAAYADDSAPAVSAPVDPNAQTNTDTTPASSETPTTPAADESGTDEPGAEPTTPVTTDPAPSTDPGASTTTDKTDSAGKQAPTTSSTATDSAVSPKLAVASDAKIVGDAKVGTTLRVDAPELSGTYQYAWSTDGGQTVAEITPTYSVTTADLGKRISVLVTDGNGNTATAETDVVTEDVAYDTKTTADAPRRIEVTAGDTLDETFAVSKGSGNVTYAIGYTDPDSSDPTDPDDQPESYLPYDTVFDAATATLRGEVTAASTFDFTVVASNGTSTATQYVEVVVDPGAAVGVMASATDTSAQDAFDGVHPTNSWIIEPNGAITTISFPADLDAEPTIVDGGQPTVQQGGSLWVDGSPVDEFGNSTVEFDDDGNFPMATVTSDHADDQIAWDDDSFSTKVTFPHASTHVLTVAEDGLSVSFPVTVNPTVVTAPVAAVTPTTAKGQLAYTGSDATGALPWALAMLAAGAGLVGLRALRRRTQR